MKTTIILISIVTLFTFDLYPQWQQDTRLTIDTSGSYSSGITINSVFASGNFVHIAWWDLRDGNSEIYYKRSTDQGQTWGTDTRLTYNPASSLSPTISVSGNAIHLIWCDYRDGNYELYYKRSTDNGITWEPDTRLTNNSAESGGHSVFTSGSNIHLVWVDRRNNLYYQIFYKKSTDGGLNWSQDNQLTTFSYSVYPSVSQSGSEVHVAWQDDHEGNMEIYHKRSTDSGNSWEPDRRLTFNSSTSMTPVLKTSGASVHIVWIEYRDGHPEIYYKHSNDAGINWSQDLRLTNYNDYKMSPSIYVSGSVVHAVWDDRRDGNAAIYYKRSVDNGLTWENDTRVTFSSSTSYSPSISASNTTVHLVWYDRRDGNYEIYYKKDPNANVNGLTHLGTEVPEKFSISQNYPNPFNPTTNFEFRIADFGFVNLAIYDVMGRKVQTLVNGTLKPGTYKADWNASNYPSGVYFYRLTTSDFAETKKMILIK